MIKALRGDSSQQQVNSYLEKDFNLIAKLESGKRNIDWQTFCKICTFKKSPLSKALEFSLFYSGDCFNETKLFNFLCSHKEVKELAFDLSLSESKIRRKLNGDTIYLTEILELIHKYFALRLQRFIDELDIEIEHIKHDIDTVSAIDKLFEKYNWIDLFIIYIDSDEYKKTTGDDYQLIANKLGIDLLECKEGISAFKNENIIDYNGTHYFNVIGSYTHKNDFESLQKKFKFMFTKSLEISETETKKSKINKRWLIFSATPSTISELNKLTNEYFAEFIRIAEADPGHEDTTLHALTLHLFKPMK